MAIIYSYPQINLSSISADDLMIISDMNADGRPTKSLTLKNLADFVTSTGTGTGTTNAIIKWSDGPAGLLGDSIMNEDTDKINLNGILRIADNNDNRLEVKYGTDSSTTHLNNAPANNHIIGRAGDLIIKNRARTRDIVFQADNGEYNGTVDTYFRLDGSMADISNSDYYTRWGNNSHIVLGPAQSTLAFDMYYDGSDTYLINGSNFLYVESKGGISIENKSGGSGDIDIIQSVTNADINISAYNGTYFKADTSAGATIFSKPVEVPLVPAANANAASKQYVDQQIASIPAGLVFQGNWDANLNSPTLVSGVGTVGNYYVVSVAGNTNLDGITDWEVGDWAVFVEVGGVDKWDKIDQTFVQGAGATGQVTFWNSINAVTGDNDFFWDNTNKRLGIGTSSPSTNLHLNSSGATQLRISTSSTSSEPQVLFIDGSSDYFSMQKVDRGMTFKPQGAEAMRIDSDGNVGIGTSSPGSKLHIDEAGTSLPALFIDTARYGASIIGDGTSNSQYLLNLQSNGGSTDVMRVQSSGNVGIGTTTPAAELDVVGRIGLNDGNNNTSIGGLAGGAVTTGDKNVFLGIEAAQTNTVGYKNTALGYQALTSNADGSNNVAVGYRALLSMDPSSPTEMFNVAVGYDAGLSVTTGEHNTIVGGLAGDALTIGSRNVAMGYNALSAEDTGNRSVAIGYAALKDQNYNGAAYNVAVGYAAGKDITSATNNTLIGSLAGDALTTGGDNVAIGSGALTSQLTGNSNVAIGKNAMTQGIATDRNVAVGYFALNSLNYTGDSYNVAVGFEAGRLVTTGIQNTFIGGLAGRALTTGEQNTSLGYGALSSETQGDRNVAIGTYALFAQNNTSSTDVYNVAIGYQAGTNVTTGVDNTIVGGLAGDAISTGSYNVALGRSALGASTVANSNISIGWNSLSANVDGSKNVAIGHQSLRNMDPASTSDTFNVAVGYHTGLNVTTGIKNTIVGGLAGESITTGSNTVVGYAAARLTTVGTDNVAVGLQALYTNVDGSASVAIGRNALYAQDPASATNMYNVAVGYNAGLSVTTGTDNTLIGGQAGDAITEAKYNVAVGTNALGTNILGWKNTAIGNNALGTMNPASAADTYNVGVGHNAGISITTGIQNTLIGGLAGDVLTTGGNNVALGYKALSSEDVGNGSVAIGAFALEDQNSFAGGITLNTAVGYEAGKNITGGAGTGDENTAIGGRSLDAETTGQENTAVGVEALGGQTGADKNTGLGWRAGRAISTGSNLTLLGYNAQSSTATVSNEITLGDSNVTALRCAVTSITSLSDERDKSDIKDLTYGLELIDSLKPKEFVWDNRAEIDDDGNEFYSANKGKKDFGFIAQEVKELDNDTLRLIYDENPERLEMSYGKLVPILVKAIQELSAKVKILENK